MRKLMLAAVALSLFGCAGPAKHDPDADLRVYGSHRIKEPVTEIISAFEADSGLKVSARLGCVRPHIVPAIKRRQDGDVLIVGSGAELKHAQDAGVIVSAEAIAWNPFVLAVKKGNPLGVASPADLKKPGMRLVLPKAGKHCVSRLSNSIIEKWDLADQAAQALRLNLKCNATVGLEMVAQGEADATLNWRIVAAQVDGIDIIPIDKAKGEPCECFAVILKSVKSTEIAGKFVQFLKGDQAQEIFRKSGLLDRNENALAE
jgi:ABC-type molybdate transport system substrate-binding protein